MSEIKLLPCPFCGGKAILLEAPVNIHIGIPCYAVACKNCKVMIGTVQEERTDFYRTPQEAIGIWNSRKPIEHIVQQLERINGTADGTVSAAIEIVQKGGVE